MTDQINDPQLPYEPPHASTEKVEKVHYGGIGRLAYLGLWAGLLLAAALVIVLNSFSPVPRGLFNKVFQFIPVVIFFYIQFAFARPRLKNMGYKPKMAWLVIVPIANMWLLGICVLGPQGYAVTQRFDRPARITLGILLAIFGVFVALSIYVRFFYQMS